MNKKTIKIKSSKNTPLHYHYLSKIENDGVVVSKEYSKKYQGNFYCRTFYKPNSNILFLGDE